MASDSSNGLNVSVVGAGIAGLTAAIALRRNGHHVQSHVPSQMFEKSESKTEIGAALGVPLNALRVLDHLGISRENLKGVPWSGGVAFDAESGEDTARGWSTAGPDQMIGLLCHRSDLYEELKRVATGPGEGLPVKLHLGTKVIACDSDAARISLISGEVLHADLVLGADGVHSVIRTHILGEVQKALPSGVSCYRTVFKLPPVSGMQWLDDGILGTRTIIAKEGPFRMLITYPCRSKTLLNFVAVFTDSHEDAQSCTPKASREDIIAKLRGFHPKFLPVLDLPAHSEIFKWQLGVLPLLPTWIRGRTALLGDAAHATLPFMAQGAAMAVEEGGSIGCLFPSGTRQEDVPQRLKAYQDIRKQRGEFVRNESAEQLKNLMCGGPIVRYRAIQTTLLQYDALATARDCYEERFGNKLLPE
ncbi:FAD/NAD(P)-binding domain-containing protein [Mycena albidolilacea]|uniref:FAD/NAD(P)-binding domain-containing protein n=1 Tax=Mycena albidolilacea TaxID=1033008 RepID=A0AAD6ZTU7_9AGAR|nr:FAD/NAD(P)-binding domain-containing protein [Mycena albidolilacea]